MSCWQEKILQWIKRVECHFIPDACKNSQENHLHDSSISITIFNYNFTIFKVKNLQFIFVTHSKFTSQNEMILWLAKLRALHKRLFISYPIQGLFERDNIIPFEIIPINFVKKEFLFFVKRTSEWRREGDVRALEEAKRCWLFQNFAWSAQGWIIMEM